MCVLAANVPAGVELPSVDMTEVDGLALLLENVTGWTQSVVSVDPRLVERW